MMKDSKAAFVKCGKKTIYINADKLKCGTQYNLNIILKLNKRIIKGTVCNKNRMPSVGAAIEVVAINRKTNSKSIVGYAYTDDKGKYLFCIENLPNVIYELSIYSPLN